MYTKFRLLLIAHLLIIISSCSGKLNTTSKNVAPYVIEKVQLVDSAAVVSAHPLATQIGIDVLKNGGNAFDAAIAVQLALAVVYPRAGNIGGGGFLVGRKANGELVCLDYREKAPVRASKNMYLDKDNNVIDGLSTRGHLAVGVPGTIAGIAATEKYGKLPLSKLIEPAIQLAEYGYLLTEKEAQILNKYQKDFVELNSSTPVFVRSKRWKAGNKIIQKDLAATLKRIQKNGKDGFYKGETAKLFVKEMQNRDGLITEKDLNTYSVAERTPIIGHYRGYKVISMPPSSSGGIALIQMLNAVEEYPLSKWGFHSPASVHLMVEAERRAYADRATYLGDSDFYSVPIPTLTDKAYTKLRMRDFSLKQAGKSTKIGAGISLQESEETTHLSIIDSEGNAVSVTTTLNSNFGSKVVVSGAGFFLNNEMDDFSAKPGVPNQFGLVGNEANAIAPRKRMLSSMTPTIVVKVDQGNGDEHLSMVLGTPGGSTIITSVFQVIVNIIDFNQSLEDAINNKRFHSQWLPDQIYYEEGCLNEPTIKKLEELGHKLEQRDAIGRFDAIYVRPNRKIEAVADFRGDDAAKGY